MINILMASTTLQNYIEYLQPQGTIPCCTACATLLAVEILLASYGSRTHLSRLYLYYMTRTLENRAMLRGAELKATLDALKLFGVAPESHWPFTFTRENREPHQQAKDAAASYKLNSYKSVIFEDFKTYLDDDIPIIIGIWTGRKFWDISGPLADHKYIPINTSDNRQSRGHAVTIIGYDDNLNNGSWIIANSAGPKWGFHGYAAIPYACNVDIGEAYVITQFAGLPTGKKYHRFDK